MKQRRSFKVASADFPLAVTAGGVCLDNAKQQSDTGRRRGSTLHLVTQQLLSL